MKKGLILINAYAVSENELRQPRRIREELIALGVQTEIRRNVLSAGVVNGNIADFTAGADFCVYLDKDKYAGELLERAGMRLFNRAAAVAVCDDKMLTHAALTGAGIAMPDTLPAPLCYTSGSPVSEDLLEGVSARLGFPVVVKECYGSLGKGVYKAENAAELKRIAENLQYKPHLFQKFVAHSAGRDLRVIVIGGKVFSAMRRTSERDFRSNVELGGKAEKYVPDKAAVELSETVAKTLGLDYCGIDLLFGEEGYLVCEVNSNAFFGGMEKAANVNVARAYAEYIVKEIFG